MIAPDHRQLVGDAIHDTFAARVAIGFAGSVWQDEATGMTKSIAAATDIVGRGPDLVPLYHRVYVILSQKIVAGEYAPEAAMPSEDELAAGFGVSRVTIRKAMERLEREGRVLRQRGRGTFAQVPKPVGPENRLLNNQISLAQKTRVEILDHGLVRLPAALAETFKLTPGTEVLRIERVRRDARSPISHTICHVVADLAPLLPRAKIGAMPVSATLVKAGVTLAHYAERVTATLADSALAALLEVEVGGPLLKMTRRAEDDGGRVVEVLEALYRPDRYEYRVEYSSEDRQPWGPWKAGIADRASG